MPTRLTRRAALSDVLGAAALAGAPRAALAAQGSGKTGSIRALAFDGFTIFDPRAVTAAVVALFPDGGGAIASTWTTKLFELSWIETAAGRYSGFRALADAALQQAADLHKVAVTPADRSRLVGTFGSLSLWPDAVAALTALSNSGVRLVFLSNLEQADLETSMRRTGLDALMEPPLSTDHVRVFKPSPRAYAMATDRFGMAAKEIGFVAFGGWDALGAKWFGYRTAWINRLGSLPERLLPSPDVYGPDLSTITELVTLAHA